ncbi:3-phosphoshikimate 1-carboxyvinyltransferase [Catalinimonas niigatensis]|uniref:3-phosphoshikimate 1-carboxyvinyltransferase n=1 Tax=Catalinimonas niigatensis TaxID=1397264 RepID=UPI0026657FFA|nr:3-phosphoshikimate 1-carboxyvinyltransferase [Catalinimonas niigatensis]WPP49403.1 3-phosphoshikimate 1-carboxyvinyltransferase [Catalinimonas niigatensis]
MGDKILQLQRVKKPIHARIQLASSKSESNRSLIIQALSKEKIDLQNLSEARDTQTMMRLLQSDEQELNVLDAGTTMRFLLAYCTVAKPGKILHGTPRMHQRPVKLLVDALSKLGASVQYLQNEGYPPVRLEGLPEGQKESAVSIRGDVSSQYISALLMIAPVLPQGLKLTLEGKIGSRPYIAMTLGLMERFGIQYLWEDAVITIEHQAYQKGSYTIESDWSGASYWYSLVALAKQAEVKLLGLREDSLQGDIAIVEIMDKLGVTSTFDEEGVLLQKKEAVEELAYDFSDCPDLAQTVAVTCAAKGIPCTMMGLESLYIKETDRVAALREELSKIGASLLEDKETWELKPGVNPKEIEKVQIHTYEDHRMAMAFAPLAALMDVIIEDPDVVVKSYPGFWKDLGQAGVVQLA